MDGIFVSALQSKAVFIDESDRVFYDVAATCDAYLITGNKKHYPVESFVFTPAEFLELLNRQI